MTTGPRTAALVAIATMLGTVLAIAAPVAAQPTPTCKGRTATIVGTSGNDRIVGTPRQDVIVALEGRDVILGREGNDIICGGPGADAIKGGAGKDQIEGGGGNDRIVGGIGKDTINGGPGKDRIFAGGGGDILDGGKNADFVDGQNGNDTCDLDSTDRFSACEQGDVVGVTGFADGTYPLSPPPEFALYRTGPGGGLQLQDSAGVYVFGFGITRVGGDLTTITVMSGEELVARIGSIDQTFTGTSTVWSAQPPTHVIVDTGGNLGAFFVGFSAPDIIPSLTPAGSIGFNPHVTLIDPPTAGPSVFSWGISPDATGSAFMLLYHPDGTTTFGMFEALGPESPRVGSALIESPVVMVEVFSYGEWFFEFEPTEL